MISFALISVLSYPVGQFQVNSEDCILTLLPHLDSVRIRAGYKNTSWSGTLVKPRQFGWRGRLAVAELN